MCINYIIFFLDFLYYCYNRSGLIIVLLTKKIFMKNNFIKKALIILSLVLVLACKNKDEAVLRVGTDPNFPPFEYHEGDKIVGFSIDMANELGKRIGKKIVFKPMTFNNLLVSLQNGSVDVIISSMTITEERKKSVNFTQGYFVDEVSLVVKDDEKDIKGLNDLKGKKVGSTLGTTSSYFADGIEGVAENLKFKETPDTFLNLIAGKIDVAIVDKVYAERAVPANKGAKILNDPVVRQKSRGDWGIAVNKKNPQLLNDLNKALTEMKKEGLFDKLMDKYFKK